MSTSPAPTTAASECRSDIFDQLSKYERLLTAKELAGMLAISPKTIYSYVERNMIPYYKIEANIRFRARDIANWLRDHGCSRLGVPEQARPATTRAGAPAWRSVMDGVRGSSSRAGMREAPESAPSAAAETILVSTQRADVGSTLNRSRNIFPV